MTISAAPTILALDLGTTSVKALVVSAGDTVIARVERPVPTRHVQPGFSEQDGDEVLRAATDATAAVLAASPVAPQAVSLSCAMHGVIPLGADGAVLGTLRTWADARGAAVATRLRGGGDWRSLQERTGTPVHASSPLCKIAAMREDEPELFARTATFVSAKELLLRRWCGADVVDLSLATATGLCSLATSSWDDDALAIAGIGRERLSQIVPTRHWVVAVDGPARDLPICVGASDGCLANLGVGATTDGIVAVTLGTSGAARVVVGAPGVSAVSGLFCYALDVDAWVIGGAVNDMGNAIGWAADRLFVDVSPPDRVAALLAAAARVPAGARGARFVPRLSGSRFPDYDSAPRGGFEGLSTAHDRDDLAAAVVDGVIDGLGQVVDALRTLSTPMREIRAGGGLLRSPTIVERLAARVGLPLVVADSVDASAIGAARLARRALA